MKILNFYTVNPRIGEDCSICSEPLSNKVVAHRAASEIQHVFHKNCLKQWIRERPHDAKCPLCNTKIEFSEGLKKKCLSLFGKALPKPPTTPQNQQPPLPDDADYQVYRQQNLIHQQNYRAALTGVSPFFFIPQTRFN